MMSCYSLLNEDGETTIPEMIIQSLGPGAVLEWTLVEGQVTVRKATDPSWATVRYLLAIPPFDPPPTPEEMDEAIGRSLAADYQRIRKGEE